MALRPNNHITGDSAVRKITSDLIPEEWTISVPDSDYGLDMLIEVVRNNKTTGKLFFIQSKGTTDSSHDGNISFSMNLERIKDYSEIKLPVLFVYYSKTEDMFWGRWMNSLYNTITEEQKKQETISLHFTRENKIDVNYLRSIGDYIIPSIVNGISLVCNNAAEEFSRFHAQVVATAKRLIGSDIAPDNRLSCKTLHLSYRGTLQNGLVEIRSNAIYASIPLQLSSMDVLYYPPLAMEECPPCFLEIIFAVAIFGSTISSQSFYYALSHPQREAFDYIPDFVWRSLLNRVSEHNVRKVQRLYDLVLQTKLEDLAQYIILVVFALVLKSPDVEPIYRSMLSRYLETAQDNGSKGCICYNLANSIRQKDLYEAFELYAKTIHFEPLYRELYYWWKEVGGVLYLTGHFSFAEIFYKKARKLSPKECREDIGILIADCQICQGKIKEAMFEEANYFDTHAKASSSILLKSIVTEMMNQRAIQVFDNEYWFNQGVSFSHEGQSKEAMTCFLIAWRLYDGDLEALVNAFIESYNSMEESKTALILTVIRELAPEEGYKMIVSILVSNNNGNSNFNLFVDALKKVFFQNDVIACIN